MTEKTNKLTFKQWHYRNTGRAFHKGLTGYNAEQLSEAWEYQEEKIREIRLDLAEAIADRRLEKMKSLKLKLELIETRNKMSLAIANQNYESEEEGRKIIESEIEKLNKLIENEFNEEENDEFGIKL